MKTRLKISALASHPQFAHVAVPAFAACWAIMLITALSFALTKAKTDNPRRSEIAVAAKNQTTPAPPPETNGIEQFVAANEGHESESQTAATKNNEALLPDSEIDDRLAIRKTKGDSQRLSEIQAIFKRYYDRQVAIDARFGNELNQDLWDRYKSINTNEFADKLMGLDAMGQTVGSFADEVFGLKGTSQAFKDPQAVNRFLTENFSTHVVDFDELEQLILDQIIALNQELIKNDNELLIECGVDIDFDAAKLGLLHSDLSVIHQEFSGTLPKLERMLEKAFATNLIKTASGLVAGWVVGDMAADFGRDANGNETLSSALLGLVAGAAAEYASDQISSEVLKTRKTIASDTRQIARQMMLKLLITKELEWPNWANVMRQQFTAHTSKCGVLIEDELGFPRGSLSPSK